MDTHLPNGQSISKLPEEVRLSLFSSQTFDFIEEVLIAAGVSDPDVSILSSELFFLASGEREANVFIEGIMQGYGLTRDQAQEVACKIIVQSLLPLKETLSVPLEEMIRSWQPITVDSEKKLEEKFEEELEAIKQDKASILETKGPLDVPAIIKEICGNPAFQFEDAHLQERCAKLIESRVRDVRTPEQTRAQLEKAVENGGLGVSGRRLSDMLAMIEGRVAAYQGNLNQEEQRKRIAKLTGVPDKTALAKKEETLLTKRYVELTGKVPRAHVAPAGPSVSRTSAMISAHHEQIQREGKIDAAKVKEAVMGAKQSVPRAGTTPSMQEVTFEKRLSGPIDELRSLSLTDFRRLSKDPSQAATKVRDKVDLMEEQGYDKKVEAIQAWRASTLNQMYVGITRDAVLQRVPVAEILQKKRMAKEETLSDEELKAVMKLNADLRF